MKYTNPRIERLKQLLSFEEQRSALQAQMDSLTEQMHSLRDSLFEDRASSASATASPAPARRGRPAKSATATPAAAPKATSRRRRMKRGALKDQIVSALQTAGEAGIRVTELAKALAIKPVNIHSWFHSALGRYPEIKKVQGGHYRLQGSSSRLTAKDAETSAPARKAAKPGRPAKSPASKPGRPAKAGRKSTRRGELSGRILAELESAGAKGINVKDLSDKIGTPYKNIYVWFATTGKKNAKVKKVGPATYKLG